MKPSFVIVVGVEDGIKFYKQISYTDFCMFKIFGGFGENIIAFFKVYVT
jgi:hypothetical protein